MFRPCQTLLKTLVELSWNLTPPLQNLINSTRVPPGFHQGSEVPRYQDSTRVPPGFHGVLQGLRSWFPHEGFSRAPPQFHQRLTRVPPGSASTKGSTRFPPTRVPPEFHPGSTTEPYFRPPRSWNFGGTWWNPWWNIGGTTPQPLQNLVEPWWNPGGTLVDWWNLTSGPPRTTPKPIWAETPQLSAVGEKRE